MVILLLIFFLNKYVYVYILACSIGTYKSGVGEGDCIPCERGKFSNSGQSSTCNSCTDGFFAPNTSMTACLKCPKNSLTNLINFAECTCISGYYSNNNNGFSFECIKCVDGMSCEQSGIDQNSLKIKPGYWSSFKLNAVNNNNNNINNEINSNGDMNATVGSSSSNSNTVLYSCPFGEKSCTGCSFYVNQSTIDSYKTSNNIIMSSCCSVGYTGVLCAVCDNGYYLSQDECRACESESSQVIIGLVITIVALIILIPIIVFIYRKYNNNNNNNSSNNNGSNNQEIQSLESPVSHTRSSSALTASTTSTVTSVKPSRTKTLVIIGLVIGFLQVFCVLDSMYDIPWPAYFASVTSFFKVVIGDIFQVLALQCVRSFNYYDSLLLSTLIPISICILCALIYSMLNCTKQHQNQSSAQLNQNNSKLSCLNYLINIPLNERKEYENWCIKGISFTLTLFYPVICYRVLNIFRCQTINDHGYYLIQDYSIQCYDTKYQAYLVYAIFVLLCIPFGNKNTHTSILYIFTINVSMIFVRVPVYRLSIVNRIIFIFSKK